MVTQRVKPPPAGWLSLMNAASAPLLLQLPGNAPGKVAPATHMGEEDGILGWAVVAICRVN